MCSHAARKRRWPWWGSYLLLSVVVCAAEANGRQTRIYKDRMRSLFTSTALRYTKPYNVCTSDWAPMVVCAGKDTQAGYSGYQVALWREIAADLGWADSDWFFSCVDWTDMINDLVDPNGNCTFAAAGVEVSLENVLKGLQFSWPIYKSGFKVLISSVVQEGGTWAFAEAFHWSVWLVLGATSVVVGLLITVAEIMTPGNKANRKGMRGWCWYTMGKMVSMQTHVGDPKTWASRIMVLGYAFLALILVHLYTATTASKLTMQRLANDISSKADLPGKKVESWTNYVPQLRKYSIDAAGLPWDNDEETAAMLNNLRTHTYQALVLDAPVVSYLASTATQCDLYPVGDLFETFNLAIAFPADCPMDLSGNISTSIVRLQTTQALMDTLDNIYIKGMSVPSYQGVGAPVTVSDRSCPSIEDDTTGASHSADIQITFTQVLGLWAIQAMTLGMALIHTAVVLIVYKSRQGVTSHRVAPAQGEESDTGKGPVTTDHHGMLFVDGFKPGSLAGTPKPHAASTCEVSFCTLEPVTSFSNKERRASDTGRSPLGRQRPHPFAADESFPASPAQLLQPQHELRTGASLTTTSGGNRQQDSLVQRIDSSPNTVVAGPPDEAGEMLQAPVGDDVLVLPGGGHVRQRNISNSGGAASSMSAESQDAAEGQNDHVHVL